MKCNTQINEIDSLIFFNVITLNICERDMEKGPACRLVNFSGERKIAN